MAKLSGMTALIFGNYLRPSQQFLFFMKKIWTPVALVFACFGPLFAQNSLKLTLEDCLDRSIKASATVKKSKLDEQALVHKIKEQRAKGYPQINAEVDAAAWYERPTEFLPGNLFGQTDYLPVQFGQPFQLVGGVRLDQKLIGPGLFSGGKLKDAFQAVAALLTEKSEEEIIFQTAQHFFQTAQNQLLVSGLQANLDKLETLRRMAEIQLKNDLATPTDVKRLQVAITNLETQKQTLLLGIEYQIGLLKLMTGLPLEQPVELLTNALTQPADTTIWVNESAPQLGTTDTRILFKNLEINKLRAKQARGENWPLLDGYARLGYSTQRADPNFFNLNGRWFPLFGLGLKMRYPIFDGFGQSNRVQQLDLESQKTEEDVRQLEGLKSLEFSMAKKQMRNSLRNLDAQRGNTALAVEVYGKVLQQYREGLTSLTDVMTAQTAVGDAETGLNREIFNYKLAELRFLKSAGRLKTLVK